MSSKRYAEELKIEAVKQITERRYPVAEVSLRQVVGWLMQPRMASELAINALLMAVWRRQPKQEVIVHSD